NVEQVTVLAPINTAKDGQPVIQATFKLAADLPAGEFLQRIREFMGFDEGHQARLGYRVLPANRSEPFLRFETPEDVENAVSTAVTRMKRAISHVVQLEITNLDYRTVPATAPEAGRRDPPPAPPVELAYNEELRIVKEKLSCARCSIKTGAPSWSPSTSSSDEDEGEVLTINDVLAALHIRQPASNYPAYKEALASKGILYARSALDSDVGWYVKEVHMPEGLVKPFLRQVESMLKKQRRGGVQSNQQQVQGDENIDPAL
ncbi:hypothetical protein GY45DRAFT_1208210, partial [Cubamyces sp. BRFM 1775]